MLDDEEHERLTLPQQRDTQRQCERGPVRQTGQRVARAHSTIDGPDRHRLRHLWRGYAAIACLE